MIYRLLIDEIMGVGDAEFRKKCDERMSKIMGERTIVLVSHSMDSIRKFANKVMWLDEGQMVTQGEPEMVIEQYLKAGGKRSNLP